MERIHKIDKLNTDKLNTDKPNKLTIDKSKDMKEIVLQYFEIRAQFNLIEKTSKVQPLNRLTSLKDILRHRPATVTAYHRQTSDLVVEDTRNDSNIMRSFTIIS